MGSSDRTRGNKHHLKHRRFPLDIRRQVLAGIEFIPFAVHHSSHGVMFWICAENSVDNLKMFSLLLNSVYKESKPFLLITPSYQQRDWKCTSCWVGRQLGHLNPKDPKDIPHYMASCSALGVGL